MLKIAETIPLSTVILTPLSVARSVSRPRGSSVLLGGLHFAIEPRSVEELVTSVNQKEATYEFNSKDKTLEKKSII